MEQASRTESDLVLCGGRREASAAGPPRTSRSQGLRHRVRVAQTKQKTEILKLLED